MSSVHRLASLLIRVSAQGSLSGPETNKLITVLVKDILLNQRQLDGRPVGDYDAIQANMTWIPPQFHDLLNQAIRLCKRRPSFLGVVSVKQRMEAQPYAEKARPYLKLPQMDLISLFLFVPGSLREEVLDALRSGVSPEEVRGLVMLDQPASVLRLDRKNFKKYQRHFVSLWSGCTDATSRQKLRRLSIWTKLFPKIQLEDKSLAEGSSPICKIISPFMEETPVTRRSDLYQLWHRRSQLSPQKRIELFDQLAPYFTLPPEKIEGSDVLAGSILSPLEEFIQKEELNRERVFSCLLFVPPRLRPFCRERLDTCLNPLELFQVQLQDPRVVGKFVSYYHQLLLETHDFPTLTTIIATIFRLQEHIDLPPDHPLLVEATIYAHCINFSETVSV